MDRNTKLTLHTGRQMPALGLGTLHLTHDSAGTVTAALELGYRLIDTAEDYGTQPGIGEGFRRSGLDSLGPFPGRQGGGNRRRP